MLDAIEPDSGQGWMRWTIRLSVGCVYLRYLVRLRRGATPTGTPRDLELLLWTAGFLLYVSHVALAFEFVFQWSHDLAWQHTAQETAKLTGLSWGAGIWANYAFTIIWAVDVIRITLARVHHRSTTRWLDRTCLLVFVFMFLNATVLFGPAHYRWLAIPTLLALFIAWRIGSRPGQDDAEGDLSVALDQ